MSFVSLSARVAVTLAALGFVSFARADLPELQPQQIVRPTQEDIQPDPDQPPGEPEFGAGVAIEGTTALVGEPGAYFDASNYARFGSAIDIHGHTMVVGARNENMIIGDDTEDPGEDNYTASGAVYVFTRLANGTWVEVQKLRPTPSEYNWYLGFGSAVEIAHQRIIVGAPSGQSQFAPGNLFIYENVGGTYVASHVVNGGLDTGETIATSGSTLLGSAPRENLRQGEAYFYSLGASAL